MEDNTKFQLRYLVMPDYIYSDERLTDVSRRVYSFIHTYKGKGFFFGNENMAEMFKCSTQAISDAIKLLQELKYIATDYKTKAGGGKSRLVIDLFSDNKPTYNRPKKTEATTSHLLIDKEYNDNNKRGISAESPPSSSFKVIPSAEKLQAIFAEKRKGIAKTKAKKGNQLGVNTKPKWLQEKEELEVKPVKDFTPLDKYQLWQIAWDVKCPPYEPAIMQKKILEQYEDGSLPEKYGNTLTFVIKKFIRFAQAKGEIEILEGMSLDMLKDDHPDNIARLQEAARRERENPSPSMAELWKKKKGNM